MNHYIVKSAYFLIFTLVFVLSFVGKSIAVPYYYPAYSNPNYYQSYPDTTYIWPSDYQKGDSYFYTWPLSNGDRFPGAAWVDAMNGDAPRNAVIYEDESSTALLYYCRVHLPDEIEYGQLIPDRGCVIGQELFTTYQVLVR